jgi:sporulation protein YlmC with PRC-barrel domain
MKIPLNARVHCEDDLGGKAVQVIVNPITKKTTHVVVEERKPPHIERLVPIQFIAGTDHDQIYLNCTRQELGQLTPLIEAEFLWAKIPGFKKSDPYLLHPYVTPRQRMTKGESVPPEKLRIRRGARVQASDGKVGWVDEFVVIPNSGAVTHLLLREGHLWGCKEVSIPVSAIERIEGRMVHLKLNRRDVQALPSVPVRRLWR